MANYHLEAQTITRSKGQSAIASSAYRAGEKLLDERTGVLHDYTQKQDVLRAEIFLPSGASEVFLDRGVLWNTVEAFEKRKDAQLAREMNISLPVEFNDTQNWDLISCFVQKEFVAKGMIADVAFHRGGTVQSPQPHAHVMLTLRSVDGQSFGPKEREWNKKDLLMEWRVHWAEHCNERYAELGFDIRIDHRTLEAQGINLEPQNKRGAIEAGQRKARVAEHQKIARRNGERIAHEPGILLHALTLQQSTFSHHDIARFVNRNSADEAQFTEVYARVLASAELVHLGRDARDLERFTTAKMLALEKTMLERVEVLGNNKGHCLGEKQLERVIAEHSLNDEQKAAVRHITLGGDVTSVVGFAGTGKSYMLGAARKAWEEAGYRVQGMTLSGIAAQNLQASSGIQSRTVSSHQWYWERGKEQLTQNDIVVVDEAGMLGSLQMADIVEKVNRANAKLVLVGDPEQLQAIAAGAAFRAISERTGFVSLTDIMRQKEVWQREATKQLATANTKEALSAYLDRGYVQARGDTFSAMLAIVEDWDEARGGGAGENSIMLAHTRKDVFELNETARVTRQVQGELGEDCKIMTARGSRIMARGDRIYFLENENQVLKVKNGTLATIEAIEGNSITANLDAMGAEPSRKVQFSLKDYNHIDLGYAATIHKAQGITVDKSYVLASPYLDRHLSYVALSRHKESCTLYYSTEEFKGFEPLAARLGRERAKDTTLDYDLTPSVLDENKEETLKGFALRSSLFEKSEKSEKREESWEGVRAISLSTQEKAIQEPSTTSFAPKTTLWTYTEAKEFMLYAEELNYAVQNHLFDSIAENEKERFAKGAARWYKDTEKRAYLFQHAENLAATMESLVVSFDTRQQELGKGVSENYINWFSGYDWFSEGLPQDCDTMMRHLDIQGMSLGEALNHNKTDNTDKTDKTKNNVYQYESKEAYAARRQKALDYLMEMDKHERRVQREESYYEKEDVKAMLAFGELSRAVSEDEAVMGALTDINQKSADKVPRYAYSMDKEVKHYQAKLERALEEDGGRGY